MFALTEGRRGGWATGDVELHTSPVLTVGRTKIRLAECEDLRVHGMNLCLSPALITHGRSLRALMTLPWVLVLQIGNRSALSSDKESRLTRMALPKQRRRSGHCDNAGTA